MNFILYKSSNVEEKKNSKTYAQHDINHKKRDSKNIGISFYSYLFLIKCVIKSLNNFFILLALKSFTMLTKF